MRPAAPVSRSQTRFHRRRTPADTQRPRLIAATAAAAAATQQSGPTAPNVSSPQLKPPRQVLPPPGRPEPAAQQRARSASVQLPRPPAQSCGAQQQSCTCVSVVFKASGAAGGKRSKADQSGKQPSDNKGNKCDVLKINQSPAQKRRFVSPRSRAQIKSPIFQKVCFILEISSFKSGTKNPKTKNKQRIFGENSFTPLRSTFSLFQAPLQKNSCHKTKEAARASRLHGCAGLSPPAGSGSRSGTEPPPGGPDSDKSR